MKELEPGPRSKKQTNREIDMYVDLFLSEDTDDHPGVDCTENEFRKWASVYIRNSSVAKKVWRKVNRPQ